MFRVKKNNIFAEVITQTRMEQVVKWVTLTFGGAIGWIIGEFSPTFPLILVAIAFILYDAWTAYELDKRVHKKYPSKVKRKQAKFTSFAFGKVVRKTIPERLVLILLAFLAEKYVFVHIDTNASYVVTGIIVLEQALSILENKVSCPDDEKDNRIWVFLRKILMDKTSRHFADKEEKEESL